MDNRACVESRKALFSGHVPVAGKDESHLRDPTDLSQFFQTESFLQHQSSTIHHFNQTASLWKYVKSLPIVNMKISSPDSDLAPKL